MAAATKRTYWEGTGSRKRSKARVRIYEGNETSTVNGMPFEDWIADKSDREDVVKRPLVVTGLADKYFFSAKVAGGGLTGQVDAIKMGLARAIEKLDESHREVLKEEDLLTRDPRKKERKKYFLLKARKRPQFSKR